VPLILDQFGIRQATCSETAVGKNVLVANSDLDAHQKIRDTLASRTSGLMWRTWIIFVGRSSARSLFKDGAFVANVLEHP
jgi:hypothetical protein